ncbi:Flavodoxin [Ruminococcus sp. YE71]|uniref:flavodoxin n=1 Tax=Ruminococcus sp. YE78 TaxID=1352374 RepID=UPI00088F0135|nr:flavodoxin [Ruminococcus sp. YE78]SDA28827.1 Flavodoxin [Ruminococcus sp. YE78]SFW47033.1 Flavodoxin [Ruminococcus sp. YE71]
MNGNNTAIIISMTIAAVLLTACGDSSDNNKDVKTVPINKSAAVYFSRVGNTDFPSDIDAVTSASLNRIDGELKGNAQLMAEWIADEADCEVFEIVSEESYPVDYDATVDQAKQEQADNKRPKLKYGFENIDDYDTIWLAFPNWWADLPMPVYSFFEEYDLSGKNIYVFITHEGSGYSSTVKTIRELEPDANVVEARSVKGGSVSDEENSIREFVKEQLSK